MKNNVTPETKSAAALSVDCKFELLFSESRLPSVLQPSPQYTITMASAKTAIKIYLSSAESQFTIMEAIRSSRLKSVKLGRDILAIETIQHAEGWPFSQEATATMAHVPFTQIEKANVHIPLFSRAQYEMASFNRAAGILDTGPAKIVYPVLFHSKQQLSRWGNTVRVRTRHKDSKYTHLNISLTDVKSAKRLRDRLARGGHTLLTLNEVVKAVLLVPVQGKTSAPLMAFGLESMPQDYADHLKELGFQKQASGVWTRANWAKGENSGMWV